MIDRNAITQELIESAERMGENFGCEHLETGWVYVLAGDGKIKIGTVKPSETFHLRGPLIALTARLRSIQALSPIPLSLLRLYTGGPAYERELHQRFAKHRLHGEWFGEVVFGEIDLTGCPTCETVIVPSDLALLMRADLQRLRGPR